jgi:hypothetical protein
MGVVMNLISQRDQFDIIILKKYVKYPLDEAKIV